MAQLNLHVDLAFFFREPPLLQLLQPLLVTRFDSMDQQSPRKPP
jgi:hypothetical protein